MNKTASAAVAFINEVKAGLNAVDAVETAFCVPATAIAWAAEALKGTNVGLGAQNMHQAAKGAYTGELSAEMVAEFCQYVILGHSERRAYFGETDEGVNQKAHAALAAGLTPIICVGESLAQNEAGETQAFVSGQIKAALAGISAENMPTVVIAYEPIWAIGTGKSANPDSAGNTIKTAVRDVISDLYSDDVAQQVRIQYGGSCKAHNIASYMAHPDIDGALVGGASLIPSFVELAQNAA